jgi:hypothetical protein
MADNRFPPTASKMKIFNKQPLERPRSMLKDQSTDENIKN